MRYHYDAALPSGFTLDAFRAAVESRGGRFVHQLPRGPLQLEESFWRWENEPSGIRYIYDHFVDVAFARVESETFGRPADLMYELQTVLPFQYTEPLLEQASSNDAGIRAHAIRSLAVTTPSFRIDVFEEIRRALFDADPRLRGTAMKAIARWPYVRFAAELDQLAQTETVPELESEAVRLAADLQQRGRRGLT